jgi:KaiC/GvpD/RAD55 family RecA-like ATPase
MAERLRTGVRELDRQFDGGFRRGSLVTLSADGAVQRGTLVGAFIRDAPALYLTTARPVESVKSTEAGAETIVHPLSPAQPIDDASEALNGMPEVDWLVVGTVDVLERQGYARYLSFLQRLQRAATRTDSVVLLNALAGPAADTEERSLTRHLADVVMELVVEENGADLETRLRVPKARCDDPPDEVLKLALGRDVRIDTSRDIA